MAPWDLRSKSWWVGAEVRAGKDSSLWVRQGMGGCCYKVVESGQWGRAKEFIVDRSCQAESLGD